MRRRFNSWRRINGSGVKISRIRAALDEGRGVRETARMLKVSPAKVSQVRRMGLDMADVR